ASPFMIRGDIPEGRNHESAGGGRHEGTRNSTHGVTENPKIDRPDKTREDEPNRPFRENCTGEATGYTHRISGTAQAPPLPQVKKEKPHEHKAGEGHINTRGDGGTKPQAGTRKQHAGHEGVLFRNFPAEYHE